MMDIQTDRDERMDGWIRKRHEAECHYILCDLHLLTTNESFDFFALFDTSVWFVFFFVNLEFFFHFYFRLAWDDEVCWFFFFCFVAF